MPRQAQTSALRGFGDMDDDGWLGRLIQYFGPFVAAWSAFLAYIVHLKKLRNAEKAAAHGRLLAEIEHLISERDVVSEERDMVRDRWAECEAKHRREIAKCEAEKLECERRAVTAEATLLGLGIGKNIAASQAAAERAAQKPEAHRGGDNG